MKTLKKIDIVPIFLEGEMPDTLKQDLLYISKEYQIAIHLCLCGCGMQAVTPLRPGEWSVTEREGKISMTPSILNRFCGTHYIITDNVANIV